MACFMLFFFAPITSPWAQCSFSCCINWMCCLSSGVIVALFAVVDAAGFAGEKGLVGGIATSNVLGIEVLPCVLH